MIYDRVDGTHWQGTVGKSPGGGGGGCLGECALLEGACYRSCGRVATRRPYSNFRPCAVAAVAWHGRKDGGRGMASKRKEKVNS
jgi:hypothetical protein